MITFESLRQVLGDTYYYDLLNSLDENTIDLLTTKKRLSNLTNKEKLHLFLSIPKHIRSILAINYSHSMAILYDLSQLEKSINNEELMKKFFQEFSSISKEDFDYLNKNVSKYLISKIINSYGFVSPIITKLMSQK